MSSGSLIVNSDMMGVEHTTVAYERREGASQMFRLRWRLVKKRGGFPESHF